MRRWNINSLEFLGKDGKLTGVKVQEITWVPNPEGGRPLMKPAKDPEIIPFVHNSHSSLPTSSWPVTPPPVPASWYVPWPAVRTWLRKSTKC